MKIFKLNTSRAKKFIRPFVYGCFAIGLLFTSTHGNLSAQQSDVSKKILVSISGIVRDAKTKRPVASAQISSLNFEAAATSNDLGVFNIKVGSLDEVLTVSAFDYGIREVSVRGKDSVVVDLYRDVFTSTYKTIGMLSGETRNTSTTQSLNTIDNVLASPFLSIDNEIQSELGGNVRSINRSGIAGLGASLFIRGLNTLNANTQPLFIVDGAAWDNSFDEVSLHSGFYTNPLATIEVADIENITIIKDGTSIYGSKAANGVVLITTNRPKGMVTKIKANAFWGLTEHPESIPVMDASQFRIYASDIIKGLNEAGGSVNMNFLDDAPTSTFYKRYHNSTNWDDLVYRPGFTQSYSLGVNGGDEKANYVFSLGYANDKSVLKNTDMQRLNARFNANINFSKKFGTQWNIGYTNMDRYLLDDGVSILTSPSFLSMIKAPFLNPYRYTVNGSETKDFEDADDFRVGNPAAIIENSLNTNKQYRFTIGVAPEYKFSPYFSVKDQFSYNLFNIRENFYRPLVGADSIVYTNPDYVSQNEVKNQQSRNIGLNNDFQLVYSRKLNYNHQLKGLLGWRYLNNSYESDYSEGHNTANDNYRSLEDTKIRFVSGLNNSYTSFSAYANVDYNYKNRYLLTLTYDMDASSRFGKNANGMGLFGVKWGVFPSANAGWIASSEKFMKNIKFINYLKIKAGYGVTGNDNIGYYSTVPYLISKSYMDKAVGWMIGNIANNEIQWETTYRKNAGIDLSMANERIYFTIDYFSSKTKDLLTLKSYPDITGLDSYWHNSGELTNKGFEATLNLKVINATSLKWEFGFSAGHYKNKIISLPDGSYSTQIFNGEVLTAVGNPAAVFYGYKSNGVFATQAEAESANLSLVDASGVQHAFRAGDIHFEDVNGDHIVDSRDKQVIGDPNPDVYGSVTNSFSFKNFTLDALITYSYGNDAYNYLRSELESGSGLYNQSTAMLNRWRAEGQITSQPKATYGDPMGNGRFSDRWIEDGSFVKLKTLTLSYKVPVKVSFIQGINIWLSVNNVLTLTKYLGRDPEFSVNNSVYYQGTDYGVIPSTRSFFVGIKLNL